MKKMRDLARARSRPRRDWRRAVRAVRQLVRDPERTMLAFEVTDAVDPDQHARSLARMLSHAEGRRIFREGSSLRGELEREKLAALPEQSFGRAYLEHLDRHGLDPGKLVELGRQRASLRDADPDLRWMAERSSLMHDLWHVLTGYGADPAGESALLPFSLAQSGGAGNVILSLGANLRQLRDRGPGWLRQVWIAWRRGRRAVCLQALPYEQLLPLPLAEVRRAAGIDPPEVAHPKGVPRSAAP